MKTFLQTLSGLVLGSLSGFDRLVFRGYPRSLMNPRGMNLYFSANGVQFRDFKTHTQERTAQLIAGSEAAAERRNRPIEYLRSPQMRKEDRAREVAKRDGITDGLIGMFQCVEPCWSYTVRGNGGTKRLELRSELRQCLHLFGTVEGRDGEAESSGAGSGRASGSRFELAGRRGCAGVGGWSSGIWGERLAESGRGSGSVCQAGGTRRSGGGDRRG